MDRFGKSATGAGRRAEKAPGGGRERSPRLRPERHRQKANFAELQKTNRKQEIESFIDKGVKEGKILPGWKDKGLAEFMGALDGQTETYEFSEGKEETPLNWFKEFINSFSEHPLFKEMAKPKKEEKTDDFSEDEALGREIAEKVNPAQA